MSGCADCRYSGWVDSGAGDGTVLRCTCMLKPKSLDEVNTLMGIPEEFWEFVEPEHWPQDGSHGKKGLDSAQWFHDTDPVGITFSGPVGVGKTHLACELLRRNYERAGPRARPEAYRYTQAEQMIQELWNGPQAYTSRASYLDAAVLLIDDLGLWRPGSPRAAAVAETIGSIFIDRWHRLRPTIITTNRDLEELFDELPPMVDRMRAGLLIEMEGDSLR